MLHSKQEIAFNYKTSKLLHLSIKINLHQSNVFMMLVVFVARAYTTLSALYLFNSEIQSAIDQCIFFEMRSNHVRLV